jgi:hypothetical protein
MCPLSYEGTNCTRPVPTSPIIGPGDKNSSGQPAIIFAGILGSVFVLISIVVICFLKRKHRRLRKEQQAQALYIASSELGGGGGHVYSMPELKTPLVSCEDTTSQLHFNNKIYARAPSCRDLVPPEITFSPAMAMSSSSFGGLRPSAPTPDENIYEEPQRRRDSEEWRRPGSDLGLERREEEVEEGYDHLDFARTQELKPQYHSTDTLRSSPQSAQSRHSSGGSHDFTSEVLTSVENLKASTRKTIYEPETDSGVSSCQNTMTSLPSTQNTMTTDIL